jgi:hypothetical protein
MKFMNWLRTPFYKNQVLLFHKNAFIEKIVDAAYNFVGYS